MSKEKVYDTGRVLNVEGKNITVGINQVLIFHYEHSNVEFWKDGNGDYHMGIAHLNNKGEEFRYNHYYANTMMKPQVPKTWLTESVRIKDIYDKVAPSIHFENYTK